MSRIRVTALFALSILALPISIADAQATFGGGNAAAATTSNQGSATDRDVPQCQAAPGGSRMRNRRSSAECEAAAAAGATVRTEHELNISLEAPQLGGPQCEATTQTEYSQRNTVTRVAGTISLANCPAGTTGTYDIVARVKDESGEIKPIEFNETWQTDTANNVAFNRDYPIGDNVELVNVRVRNLKCTCEALPGPAPVELANPN